MLVDAVRGAVELRVPTARVTSAVGTLQGDRAPSTIGECETVHSVPVVFVFVHKRDAL